MKGRRSGYGSGIAMWTRTGAVRRSRLGVRRTFQRPQVFGRLTVLDNVLAAVEWHGGGGGLAADLLAVPSRRHRERARREQALTALDHCGIAATAHRDAIVKRATSSFESFAAR